MFAIAKTPTLPMRSYDSCEQQNIRGNYKQTNLKRLESSDWHVVQKTTLFYTGHFGAFIADYTV